MCNYNGQFYIYIYLMNFFKNVSIKLLNLYLFKFQPFNFI